MFNSNIEIWKNAAHGVGSWTRSIEGSNDPVHRGGPWTQSRQGVHVLYFPAHP
jgi:hypothetical protein